MYEEGVRSSNTNGCQNLQASCLCAFYFSYSYFHQHSSKTVARFGTEKNYTSNSNMAWTTDDVMKLISSMKELPALYNRDLPPDPDNQASAIEHIQAAVNKPWSLIKKKWSDLRAYHKILYLTCMQNKHKDKPKWQYYDSMAFAVDSEYRYSSKFDCALVSSKY